MKKLYFIAAIALTACNMPNKEKETEQKASVQQYELLEKWESDSLLKVPESVLFDKANQILYVSNLDGSDPWKADGKGSIAKVGLDGKIIATEWVSGLNAPKGMGLYNGKLYAADLGSIAVIDMASGKIEKNISIQGATGLNDISIDPNGVIYVTEYLAKKLYKVENEKAELIAENLTQPNGVLFHNNELFLLDGTGMFKVNADKSLAKIVDGMEGGVDGIENIEGNNFIVSCWEGALWMVNTDGTKHLLMDTRKEKRSTADIGFDPATKTVYVPTFFRNTVVAYELK
jgi:sugar lactone lactonase YvrE|uniref:SMP-30/gluconolactonase/LRE family protein n=1 Tax=Daejeonella sp. TaxID=2805397 RepID=UPI00404A78A1